MRACLRTCACVCGCTCLCMLVWKPEVALCSSPTYTSRQGLSQNPEFVFMALLASELAWESPCHYFASAGILGRHTHPAFTQILGIIANAFTQETSLPSCWPDTVQIASYLEHLTFPFSHGCSGVICAGDKLVDVNCHFCDTACS